ncbi:uncharacterized protein CPUR_05648 [Claviceps purpurea 20.1]|uniref:F-box domain-containing protein n=1 Tax=Claviceps purpurea (strain 20.1) TaxID=1111077 RepID=M1WCS3_CLAP2|nr:uncharacterized protein CPUR_05648 [Claviceps purpurea 20.1]
MDSAARKARLMARERDTDESRCLMALLPPETKIQIMSYISTQQSLSRLSQSCRAWYGTATQELYNRDAKEHTSFAIKWMAAHAVDEQRTDSAIRTIEISRRWGGQIDAVERHLSPLDEARSDNEDQMMSDTSTALHFAVFLGNVRLTKTLLDMKASLTIPFPALCWTTVTSEELFIRFGYFLEVLDEWDVGLGLVFPIFLAFLRSDTDMCKLLLEHGAGREAMILGTETGPQVMSILHFAAADPTKDYRQWQCLFDKFREYVDEPCPRIDALTPLHVALRVGCTQGMQIAVETGADKEARNGFSHTPLSSVAVDIIDDNPSTFEERTVCIRKFMELGASLNSEVDSMLSVAVRSYIPDPLDYPLTRNLIYFLLEHRADIHGTSDWQNTNMVNEILDAIFDHRDDPESLELLKELLSHLVDGGLNFTTLSPGLPSPLCRVLNDFNSDHGWLIDLLCDEGATIHEHELNRAFICWCHTTELWETNQYDAWWQHQGQEDEIFQKWCEHPHNVWWWQHVERISLHDVEEAYEVAFGHKERHLYDLLTHLPLPALSDDILVMLAALAASKQPWAWRLIVLHEFEDNFVVTWHPHRGENMIHLTVHLSMGREGNYPAADAIQDILYLRNKGVDMTARNAYGTTPLEILLESGASMNGFMELAALLEGNEYKTQGPTSGLRAQ